MQQTIANNMSPTSVDRTPCRDEDDGQSFVVEEGAGTVDAASYVPGDEEMPVTMTTATTTTTTIPTNDNGNDALKNGGSGFCVFVTGLSLALFLLFPNIMMLGTAHSKRHGWVGVTANVLFLMGGVVGLVTPMEWWALLPGGAVQLLAFLPFY
mmetsp:Transcript_1297/g.3620  ORF Transcript_1297/g.3620 Transcript_1297/m.3620 type:complete len:153 (-) Transcript_1297:872-1330(-)